MLRKAHQRQAVPEYYYYHVLAKVANDTNDGDSGSKLDN
jgi:hypothetical protein